MKIHKLKLADRKFRDDPWKVYSDLRQKGEIIKVKLPFMGKTWAATTYESVNEILKNSDDFVRDPKNAGRKNFIPMQWIFPRSFFSIVNNMLGADGQKHRRLRMLVDRAFAMRNIDAMSEQIQSVALQQLSVFATEIKSSGKADLMEHYAKPFPLTVICELLGLPLQDRPKFKEWFAPFSTVKSVFGVLKMGPGIRSITKYLKDQFEQVRSNPRPGLISNLVQTEMEGEKLSEDELLSMAFLLLVAGHETTVHLISNMILTLLQHPETKTELFSDWTLGDAAIDETLRYCSPIQLSKPRYVSRDFAFRGQQLKRGEMMICLLASANCDPARFDKPTEFNIHRERNYHMTFGSGPHVCLGMKLAKTEAYHAVKTLFDRFPDLTAQFDLAKPDWSNRIGTRGMKTLLVSG